MAVITFPDNPSIGDRTFDQRYEWNGTKWVYLPPPQIPGDNGWTPVFAIETDDVRRVLKVVDWLDGGGTKPAINVYVGASGFVSDIADGINIRGADGIGITSLVQTSGTGAAGTVDTYTITFSDATTTTFDVYNGADGTVSGNMLKSAYDSNDDGKVNSADVADSVPWSGVTGKPVNATTSVDGFLSAADKTKLDSVSTGATANSSDATLLNRANHTGTQAISTVSGLQGALDAKAPLTGAGTSGTWPISVSGNAATANSANSATAAWISAALASSTSADDYSAVIRSPVGGSGDASVAALGFLNGGAYGLKMYLRSDGFFGIGGWSRGAWGWYLDASNNMVVAGNVSAYSDPRLKENFERVSDPFAILNKLDGGTFTWRHGFSHIASKAGKRDYGILADQVQAVMPEIVTESIDIDDQKYLTVAYEKLVPVLIEAVRQMDARIKELEAK